ncbi:MAG: DUF805 domain-containing protein [Caulobacteraceae bacterium]|nr:DUF805 domain-containing protein [Caulobacteraceae bacterium]
MLTAIKHNLSRLTDFKGRETRGQFWPWVACVFAGFCAAWFVAMATVMATTFGKMQAWAEAHPEQAIVTSEGGSTSVYISGSAPGVVPDFGLLLLVLGGLVVVIVALLAAAVTRRLHDCSRSAFWGLAPLPFLAFGLTAMNVMMRQTIYGPGEPDMALFGAIGLNNIVYLGVLLTLIIQLSRAGSPQANRFGPPVG